MAGMVRGAVQPDIQNLGGKGHGFEPGFRQKQEATGTVTKGTRESYTHTPAVLPWIMEAAATDLSSSHGSGLKAGRNQPGMLRMGKGAVQPDIQTLGGKRHGFWLGFEQKQQAAGIFTMWRGKTHTRTPAVLNLYHGCCSDPLVPYSWFTSQGSAEAAWDGEDGEGCCTA